MSDFAWVASTSPLVEDLFPGELAYIKNAGARRFVDFATVRFCARQALSEFGVVREAMVPGGDGASIWPAGFVGSMTHTDGLWVAAVARTSALRSLGIDAELHAPLPDDVLTLISPPLERDDVTELGLRHPAYHWDRIIFCAKEAAFKAWSPYLDSSVDFRDLLIDLDCSGTFVPHCADFLFAGRSSMVRLTLGFWWCTVNHIVTMACVLP